MRHPPRVPALLFVAPLILCLPGCVFLAGAAVAVGAVGVVVAVSEDTARVDIRGDEKAIYETVLKRMEQGGEVTYDRDRGTVEGRVEGSSVTIRVFTVDEFVRVTVSARQLAGAFPDLDLAEEIATEISRAHS